MVYLFDKKKEKMSIWLGLSVRCESSDGHEFAFFLCRLRNGALTLVFIYLWFLREDDDAAVIKRYKSTSIIVLKRNFL